MGYTKRYDGIRWKIVFGQYSGVEKFAINQLQSAVQSYLPYVIELQQGSSDTELDNHYTIAIGTVQNNPLLKRLVEEGHLEAPATEQSFSLRCWERSEKPGNKIIAVAGHDPEGVLYATFEFIDQVMPGAVPVDHSEKLREAFDRIAPFQIADKPAVANRGIWTWGYVVYDYRRFLDNMARLRMNMITLWNDCPPINAQEFVQYAHSRGIQVIMGFHWGWGVDKLDPNNAEDLQKTKAEVLDNYLNNYVNLDIDGIYFQTFTETRETEIGGKSIAELSCQWVNEIAVALYEVKPDLYIQFGLHATSIVEDYVEFKALDPRITITWEDCGALPFSYDPVTDVRELGIDRPEEMLDVEQTLSYCKKLVAFRENREFAVVPKGYNALRWDTDFEHHDSFIIGERDSHWISRRSALLRPRWKRIDSQWLENRGHASRFYRELIAQGPDKITSTALVEDGVFEEHIPLSVALFAETLWNPDRSDEMLLQRAVRITNNQ